MVYLIHSDGDVGLHGSVGGFPFHSEIHIDCWIGMYFQSSTFQWELLGERNTNGRGLTQRSPPPPQLHHCMVVMFISDINWRHTNFSKISRLKFSSSLEDIFQQDDLDVGEVHLMIFCKPKILLFLISRHISKYAR